MNKIICAFVVIFFGVMFSGTAQSNFVKEINSSFVKVKSNLYFARFETTNKEYRNFLHALQQDNRLQDYQQNLLDTAQWSIDGVRNLAYIRHYHAHTAYDSYPVVTVTHQSAKAYCAWLTNRYNADPLRKFKNVLFRLPTEEEWVYAATAGKNRLYAWDGKQLKNKKGMYLANIRRIHEANLTFDPVSTAFKHVAEEGDERAAILAEKQSFYPNEFGLYNMIGNAAEMVAEKGKTKGGSYNNVGYDVRVQHVQSYTSASPEVGFRVVMEIVEE